MQETKWWFLSLNGRPNWRFTKPRSQQAYDVLGTISLLPPPPVVVDCMACAHDCINASPTSGTFSDNSYHFKVELTEGPAPILGASSGGGASQLQLLNNSWSLIPFILNTSLCSPVHCVLLNVLRWERQSILYYAERGRASCTTLREAEHLVLRWERQSILYYAERGRASCTPSHL